MKYQIKVNKNQSRSIQEAVFQAGGCWFAFCETRIHNCDKPYLILDMDSLTLTFCERPNLWDYEEISFEKIMEKLSTKRILGKTGFSIQSKTDEYAILNVNYNRFEIVSDKGQISTHLGFGDIEALLAASLEAQSEPKTSGVFGINGLSGSRIVLTNLVTNVQLMIINAFEDYQSIELDVDELIDALKEHLAPTKTSDIGETKTQVPIKDIVGKTKFIVKVSKYSEEDMIAMQNQRKQDIKSTIVQQFIFEAGGSWIDGDKSLFHHFSPYLTIDENFKMAQTDYTDQYPEIAVDDLILYFSERRIHIGDGPLEIIETLDGPAIFKQGKLVGIIDREKIGKAIEFLGK